MSDKKDSNIAAVVVVVIIATVCAAGLAFIKDLTADAIQAALDNETLSAVAKVVPKNCEADLAKQFVFPEGEGGLTFYPAYDKATGDLCAFAVKTQDDKGYGGRLQLLAGFSHLDNPEGLVLQRVYVLTHSETPGLGSKATVGQDEDPDTWGDDPVKVFGVNFRMKQVKDMSFTAKKAAEAGPNDVSAITASTVTSRAVTNAAKKAAELVKGNLEALKQKGAR